MKILTSDGSSIDEPMASLSLRLVSADGPCIHHCNGVIPVELDGGVGRGHSEDWRGPDLYSRIQ